MRPNRKQEAAFLKKSGAKKLLLIWGMGFGCANAHAPDSKKFLRSFF
jgi:hypothetical protein